MGTICVLLVVWKELFCHTLLHSSHLSSATFCVNDWVQLGASKEGLIKSVHNHARKGFQENLCGTLWSSVKLWNKLDGVQVPHYGIGVTPDSKYALAIIDKKHLFFSHYVCFSQFYQVFWGGRSGIVERSGSGSDKTFQRLSNFTWTLGSLFVMSFKNGKQIHDCQHPSFVVGGNRKGWHLFPNPKTC